jgi:hypothetical protein
MNEIGRLLLFAGLALVLLGGIFLLASRFGITRLPGDFAFRRDNVTCIVPIATSILLSILLTLILWFFRR